MRILSKVKNPKATRIIGGALGLLLALSLVLVPATPVAALPPPGHYFYGNVTGGIEITAEVAGLEYYTTVDAQGRYGWHPNEFSIPGDDPDVPGIDGASAGDLIKFYINGVPATLYDVEAGESLESYPFESGGTTELNLTITVVDTTAPTVVITELTPDPTNVNTPTFTGTATDELSNIASVEYKVDDEWLQAEAVDGAFDSLSEEYTFTTGELLDEVHTVYVRATDAAENTTAEADYDSDEFVIDTTLPTVLSTTPEADAPSVAIDIVVSATFSEDIDEGTLVFTLDGILGTLSYDSITKIASFTPDANLNYETGYTANVQASDLAGNPLSEAHQVWSFITATEAVGPVSFTTTLLEDWNLLSTPIKLDAESDTMGQIFDTESYANIEISYRWDTVIEDWVQVLTDYELLPLYGIYVKISSGASATAEFIPSEELSWPPTRVLQPGLNLIGPAPALAEGVFPEMPLDQALVTIAEAEGGLRGYTMVVSPAHNQTDWVYTILDDEIRDLCPYKGYWVVMTNAATLVGGSTTP